MTSFTWINCILYGKVFTQSLVFNCNDKKSIAKSDVYTCKDTSRASMAIAALKQKYNILMLKLIN